MTIDEFLLQFKYAIDSGEFTILSESEKIVFRHKLSARNTIGGVVCLFLGLFKHGEFYADDVAKALNIPFESVNLINSAGGFYGAATQKEKMLKMRHILCNIVGKEVWE